MKIKKYLHAHPSHVNAFWVPNLLKSGLRPVDAMMLKWSMGFTDDSGEAWFTARTNIIDLGLEVLPGVGSIFSLIHGHDNSDCWYDPANYERVVGVLEQMLLAPGSKFFLDVEPYFEGDRYPANTPANQRKIYAGCKPLRDYCKAKKITAVIMPGADKSYAFIQGFKPWAKIQADEWTYAIEPSDFTGMRKRWAYCRTLKQDYWPGFNGFRINDTDFLAKVKAPNIWFYLEAHPEKYWLFGTEEWNTLFPG